ncbi:hypothetical protein RchiOBHm_Chr5g0074541 [Rosa chinensis]|uniref:Uncharacterized protein n=1 Tax=Rosa chinensis TaxID=74649 RepID=A0A2P6QL84_ROSCH|nr:hypothetical protein RchiOBHm_Chr5g0074541 [Rosa chinensis]
MNGLFALRSSVQSRVCLLVQLVMQQEVGYSGAYLFVPLPDLTLSFHMKMVDVVDVLYVLISEILVVGCFVLQVKSCRSLVQDWPLFLSCLSRPFGPRLFIVVLVWGGLIGPSCN